MAAARRSFHNRGFPFHARAIVTMLNWLLFLALGALAVTAADRAWQRHARRAGERLHDPDGYLELTARMTELCHGDRRHVDALIEAQQQLHPQASHAEAVQLAMRQLLESEAERRRS